MADELLAIADELRPDPPQFTLARRGPELKGTDLAKEVKALKKPSMAGWVVNLLVRHEADQVEQLLQVGQQLRAAQESMSGDELRHHPAAPPGHGRGHTQARRLREHGQKVTEAVAAQVEATLTAAMVDEEWQGRAEQDAPHRARVDRCRRRRPRPGIALPDALGFVASIHEAAHSKPGLHVVRPRPRRRPWRGA
jgi:hypothetical protein